MFGLNGSDDTINWNMNPTPGILADAVPSYLFLTVRDFDAVTAFYRDTLGLHVDFFSEHECAFFRTTPGAAFSIAVYAGRRHVQQDGHWFIAFDVADLDRTVARLRSAGVVVDGVHEQPFGRYAKFSDPEGNVIEVHEPVAGNR